MSKSPPRSGWLLIAATVAALCACAKPSQQPENETERELRAMLDVPGTTRLIYQDESGAPLTVEEFKQHLEEGASFTPQRDEAANGMTLRLLAKSPPIPARLPEFDLARLDGARVRTADLAGGFALVNFFFETCVPCIKEVPALNEFRRKHPEFRYLAVTFDSTGDAARFVEQRRFEWPVAAEARDFIDAAGVRTYPTYMLLAPDGRVLGQGSGMNVETLDDPAKVLAELEHWVSERLPTGQ